MTFQECPKICPICKQRKKFKFIRDFEKKQDRFSLYQCSKCLVQFWLPLKVPGYRWYEQGNPYQIRDLIGSKIYRGYHKNFLKRYKNFPKNTKILDLGCGAGEFIAELKKRGCQVWGVDFDREAVRIAKQRFGLKNIYDLSLNEFFQKNDLPKFDIITLFEVIEHLDDPLAFFLNVKNLLKPGGQLVISTPFRKRFWPNRNSWDFPPHHFTRWDETAISNLLEKIGLKVSAIFYVEQLKIISESIADCFKTGLVSRSLEQDLIKKRLPIIPKIIYHLGVFKHFILGTVPAFFVWLFSKIMFKKNGIMFVETEKQNLNKTKKIFFFLPTLSIGGGERVVSELSLNLPDSIDIKILLFKNQVSYPFKGEVICLDIPLSNNLIKKVYYFFVGIYRFKKIIKKENPDHIIAFGVPANIISLLSTKKTIARVDNFMSSSAKGVYKFLIKLLYNRACRIVSVSKASALDLIKNFKIKEDKIKVIYNPLNTDEINILAKESLEPKYEGIFKNPVIISMGRLSGQKSQWYLIRAFSRVKKSINNARLVILGNGELEQDLKNIAEELNLGGSVHFLGWQKNPFKFLARSKVFALSSLWEGLPYVVLEALACGLPVVSADCKSGPREILAPETDFTKEAKDIEYAQFGILTQSFKGQKYGAKEPLDESEDFFKKAIIEALTNKKIAEELYEKSKKRAGDFNIKNIIKEWEFLG